MIVPSNSESISAAANLLRQGQLVAFPTETVYGLGADARNEAAVRKIFAAKGRPADHPLIVHLSCANELSAWAVNVSDAALNLATAFWPGPLTLILQKTDEVSPVVTGGQTTVGLRIPGHPVALELLRTFGSGIAAPSANLFGHISPTRATHVQDELHDHVSMILEGGACQVGLESTIVDCSTNTVRILRPGGIDAAAIADQLGYQPEVCQRTEIRVSGSLESHYAPRKPTSLVEQPPDDTDANLGVIAFIPAPTSFAGQWLQMPEDAQHYAQSLYNALRQLDASSVERIVVQRVPDGDEWLAVRDRLQRATSQ
ncbi:MAG: threonylcarbamoyl-AMP synthase [Planctomycetales bacterium]|nr:threonylcarbamoyl-AMP synthase [Planctomycetales bacterium]